MAKDVFWGDRGKSIHGRGLEDLGGGGVGGVTQ